MNQEKFLIAVKGLVARFMLGILTKMPMHMIMLEITSSIEELGGMIKEAEGHPESYKYDAKDMVRWMVDCSITFEDFSEMSPMNKMQIMLLRSVLDEDTDGDLLEKLDKIMGKPSTEEDLSLFEDFMDTIGDTENDGD